MATVNLGDHGLSPGDPIDDLFEQHFVDGNVVEIPAGRYVRQDNWDFRSIGDVTVRGVGGRAIIDAGDRNEKEMRLEAIGSVTFEDITFAGRKGVAGPNESQRVEVIDPAGDMTFRNCRWPDGSIDGSDAHGVFVGSNHDGDLLFENCVVRRFGDNGIYASAPGPNGGPVRVIGGMFENNNIAGVRIGTDGSVVRGANFVTRDHQVPAAANGALGPRGIRIRRAGRNMLIEDCDFVFDTDGWQPIRAHPDIGGATGTIRNNRIQQDGDAPCISLPAGSWSGGGNHLTGAGNLAAPNHLIACRGSGCDTPIIDQPDEPPDGGEEPPDNGEEPPDNGEEPPDDGGPIGDNPPQRDIELIVVGAALAAYVARR